MQVRSGFEEVRKLQFNQEKAVVSECSMHSTPAQSRRRKMWSKQIAGRHEIARDTSHDATRSESPHCDSRVPAQRQTRAMTHFLPDTHLNWQEMRWRWGKKLLLSIRRKSGSRVPVSCLYSYIGSACSWRLAGSSDRTGAQSSSVSTACAPLETDEETVSCSSARTDELK